MNYVCKAVLRNECLNIKCPHHFLHEQMKIFCAVNECEIKGLKVVKDVECVKTNNKECKCYMCIERKLMGE